jgi:hypothetical protein
MKLLGCQQIATILTVLAAACCVSCNRSASTATTAAARNAKAGPEESLSQIMDVFRRRMEDTPIGFVATNSGGRTAMTGMNKVSYEFVRPANDVEPYRAVVTVKSQSQYSILRTAEPSKEDGRDKAKNGQPPETLDEADADALAFDSGTSGSAAEDKSSEKSTASRAGEAPVARRPDEEVRKYELIYESGRWKLVTKLNEQTEKSIENAFSNALNTQN